MLTATYKTAAFFLLVLFFPLSFAEPADCPADSTIESVQIHQVIDGDTLRLKDGRKIRLIGINTPEAGFDGKPSQPLAFEAKKFVTEFFGHGKTAKLQLDIKHKDRYGRWLGHLFNQNGENLEAALLTKGLAFHVAIPPNLSLANCLSRLEHLAKTNQAGLWESENYLPFTKPKPGYRRITATAASVEFGHWWKIRFEADDQSHFTALIKPKGQKAISRETVIKWLGKSIEVEGWLYAVNVGAQTQLRINISTPFDIAVHD